MSLEELLSALHDEGPSDDLIDRLDQALSSDADAQDRFIEFMALASDLHYYFGAPRRQNFGLGEQPAIDPRTGSSRRPRLWPALLATAALVAMVASLITAYFLPAPSLPAMTSAEVTGIAVITQAVDAQWDASGLSAEVGRPLEPGKLKLLAGLAQIEFYSGATVILEGPAEFDLISAQRGFFHLGKVRAHVPPQATGFTIGAPGMEVVDLGTEFGLSLSAAGLAEVHVFEGKVELHDPATRSQQELSEGQGLRWSADSQPQAIDVDEQAFVDRSRLADLTSSSRELASQEWQRFSQALGARPDVLLYYSFGSDTPWQRTIENMSHGSPAPDGAIVGAQWTDGRWPGARALEFKGTSDRVRIEVPGQYESLTLSMWVRFDGFDNQLSALMICDGAQAGRIHWQVVEDGRLRLTVMRDRVAKVAYRSAPGVISAAELGRWVHLAVVCDAKSQSFIHYFNGRPLASDEPMDFGKATDDSPLPSMLTIGRAEIGNWNAAAAAVGPAKPWYQRNLNGRMDEFIVFSKALSDDEILQLYEAGKP